jgi:putative transposase
MPRRARVVIPEVPLHIIQRGNNRQNCFFTRSDYLVYRDLLCKNAKATGSAVHAYVLMTNHVHLLISPAKNDSAGLMMKAIGERYVQYVNQTYGRSGTLWDGRFKSCPVQDEKYMLICQRYIELNPVRAGMVTHPALYPWSSHECNAFGKADEVITAHTLFDALGDNQATRMHAYRELFHEQIGEPDIASLRDATNYNYVFGSAEFAEKAEKDLGCQVARVLSRR